MIDLENANLISIGKAAKIFGKSPCTVWRWCTCGLRGGIKLWSIRVGGTRLTSHEAIQQFIQAQNEDAEPVAFESVSTDGADVDLAALRERGFEV